MFEECVPLILVTSLLDRSGFGDAIGCIESAASDDIQEITFLGGCLMWNNAAVFGDRIRLIICVCVWYDMWKFCERESVMMFSVPLICCEYRDVSLLTRFHPSQRAVALCDSMFTGSKYALCIQPSVLEISVNDKIRDPYPSCRMVM